MSEMVERVRRALESYTLMPVSEGEARAAIEAMREPTDEMLSAWASTTDVCEWSAMIDAALSPNTAEKAG